MKGQSTGGVAFVSKTGKYQGVFYHPLEKKNIHLGFYDTEEEARLSSTDAIFDFYYKNSLLLPKGIHMDVNKRVFTYSVPIRKKYKYIFGSKVLKEVIEARLEFIKSLV